MKPKLTGRNQELTGDKVLLVNQWTFVYVTMSLFCRKKPTWSQYVPAWAIKTKGDPCKKDCGCGQRSGLTEKQEGLKFKVVESWGRSIAREVQKSNPTATPGCSNTDCVACKPGRGAGGNCLRPNIQYEFRCKLCPDTETCGYIGEISRN